MTEAYREEFAELTARAKNSLQHPDINLPHRNELFRLWRYPSFEPYVSWHVYFPFATYLETDLPIAVRVRWNRPFDYTRFRDPLKGLAHSLSIEPTLEQKEVELSRSELDSRLATLQTIKIPVVVDSSVVIDGVSSGFQSFGTTAVKLEWQWRMPEGWKQFIDWTTEMTEFLDGMLEGR